MPIIELELNNNRNVYKPKGKQKLLILSDLWGFRKFDWANEYTQRLKLKFEVLNYDCCSLGDIDVNDYKEDILHKQFINGGIKIAAKKLVALEKTEVDILAFSIGGIIAWKAGLLGLKIRNFYSVSSTRLRYETQKPKGNIKLFFGEKDVFKPKDSWQKRLNVDFETVANKTHTMYKEEKIAAIICDELTNLFAK